MKKLIFLFAIAAVTLFTSCNKEDDSVNKQTFQATINNRAVDADNDAIVFSQSTASVELNLTDYTIQITNDFKDAIGQTYTLKTPAIEMSAPLSNSYVYTFKASNVSSSTEVTNLSGKIDLATGVMYFQYNVNDCVVYSTTQLVYYYVTTTITGPEGQTYNHTQSPYLFAFDGTGQTCMLEIGNLIPTTGGAIQAASVDYNGITSTPTKTGYTFTASEVESSYAGYYAITDLNITADYQGQHIYGSFVLNNHTFNIDGTLFGAN